jgi:hypothetical protein
LISQAPISLVEPFRVTNKKTYPSEGLRRNPFSQRSPLARSGVQRPTLSVCQKKPPKQVEIPKVEIPKVVPLTEEKHQVIATDQKSQRILIGIGEERIAFDLFTRFTRLSPHTGDQPAPVVAIKKKRK